jgi:hypothetical protein
MIKYMNAKFRGTCATTGRPIRRGDEIAFDTVTRKAYLKGKEPVKGQEEDQAGRMIADMENDAMDRWAAANL